MQTPCSTLKYWMFGNKQLNNSVVLYIINIDDVILTSIQTYLWFIFISLICYRGFATTLESAEIHFTVVIWLEIFFPYRSSMFSFSVMSLWNRMWRRTVTFTFIKLTSLGWLYLAIIHFTLMRLSTEWFCVTLLTFSGQLKTNRKYDTVCGILRLCINIYDWMNNRKIIKLSSLQWKPLSMSVKVFCHIRFDFSVPNQDFKCSCKVSLGLMLTPTVLKKILHRNLPGISPQQH